MSLRDPEIHYLLQCLEDVLKDFKWRSTLPDCAKKFDDNFDSGFRAGAKYFLCKLRHELSLSPSGPQESHYHGLCAHHIEYDGSHWVARDSSFWPQNFTSTIDPPKGACVPEAGADCIDPCPAGACQGRARVDNEDRKTKEATDEKVFLGGVLESVKKTNEELNKTL